MEKFEVCAKCGHVGRNYFIEKVFAVEAVNRKEAAAKVRCFPRVKHDHKDAIRYVKSIDDSRFNEILEHNRYDPYFFCRNIQEQRKNCDIGLEIQREPVNKEYKKTRHKRKQTKQNKGIQRVSNTELVYAYYDEVYNSQPADRIMN